jgi:hypothetical protein
MANDRSVGLRGQTLAHLQNAGRRWSAPMGRRRWVTLTSWWPYTPIGPARPGQTPSALFRLACVH